MERDRPIVLLCEGENTVDSQPAERRDHHKDMAFFLHVFIVYHKQQHWMDNCIIVFKKSNNLVRPQEGFMIIYSWK